MLAGLTIAILLEASPALQIPVPIEPTIQREASDIMQADRFWHLIGLTTKYDADQEAQIEALRAELRKLSAQEIEAFERTFHEQQRRAYSWDLWGAAYVMNGGASDDGFEYFQRWLISKGRAIFEAAIANPDSLSNVSTSEPEGLLISRPSPMSRAMYGRRRLVWIQSPIPSSGSHIRECPQFRSLLVCRLKKMPTILPVDIPSSGPTSGTKQVKRLEAPLAGRAFDANHEHQMAASRTALSSGER